MALRINRDKKQIKSKIKEKQEELIQSIAVEKKALEEIIAIGVKATFLTAEQQKAIIKKEIEIGGLDKVIKEKTNEVIELEKEFKETQNEYSEKTKEYKVILKSFEEYAKRTEKEKDKVIKEKEKIIQEMDTEIEEFQKTLGATTEKNRELIVQNKDLSSEVAEDADTIYKLNNEIYSKKAKASDLEKYISLLKEKKVNLEAFKSEKIRIEQTIELAKKSLKETRRQMMDIERTREIKMKDLDERETIIKRREDRVKNREDFVENRDKDIDLKAYTLQKHFDKQNIPITVI